MFSSVGGKVIRQRLLAAKDTAIPAKVLRLVRHRDVAD
jgi:hypothetical protein